MLKKTGKHSLAVFGSFCMENLFLFFIFVPFQWLDRNELFTEIQISSEFSPFQTCREK